MLVLCLLITCVIHANAYEGNGIRNVKDYVLDKAPVERRLFHLKKNGFKVDVRVVPSFRNDSAKGDDKDDGDRFPKFPVGDIGKCILELSLGCIKKRFVRFLETIGRLDEITLLGQDVKLIKSRALRGSDSARAMNDSDVSIERTLDDFFDSFTLRITLPRWNGRRENNQIDVMLDETAVAEGRGKGGGGGGGGGGGCGKGGKCRMMMMGMLMMIKMKLLGLAAIKGMMMGGMSMMMLLMQKFGKGGGGGPWQSGGGPWQSGGQLKEIVLLTKSSGGGGGGGHGCCGPSDSYGAPPASSYGPPSGGGGGYGGGGWGRSFHKRPMILSSHDGAIKTETADGSNGTLMIGEATSRTENVDYPDYQDYYQEPSPIVNSNFTSSRWNATNNIAIYEYADNNVNVNSLRNDSKLKSMTNAKGRNFVFNENPSNNKTNIGDERSVDLMASTDRSDSIENANLAYEDEWQATAEKMNPSSDVSSSNANAMVVLRRVESRSRDVPPLLRGI